MEKQKNSLFYQYKDVIFYIIKFVFLYTFFSVVYSIYLSFYGNQTDFFTRLVAHFVHWVYDLLGIKSQILPLNTSGLKLIIKDIYVARIVEGCSAMSLIILFSVFILSLGKFSRKTVYFIVWGIFSIFIFNIFRIVLLGYVLYAFPSYQDVLHRILFPALIYAWVVFLWVIYIYKFYEKK